MDALRIEILDGGAPAAAIAIRTRVFIEEQGVTEREEMDGLDSDCIHFVAYRDDTAVGCARLRPLGDARAKIERVAVLPELRARGLGRAIMNYDQSLEPILRDNNFLSRDPRRVERKKYGQPKARKRFQFSKR